MDPPFANASNSTDSDADGRQPRSTQARWAGAAQKTVMGTSEWKPNRTRPNESVSSIIHVLFGYSARTVAPPRGRPPTVTDTSPLMPGHGRPCGRHGQPELGAANQLVDRFASRQRPRLFVDDGNALATLLQVVLAVACAMNLSDREHTQEGGKGFVASDLALAHGVNRQRVRKRAR